MIAAVKAHFLHSRTIFVARVYSYLGVAVTAYDGANVYLQGADFTPLSTRALDYVGVPADLRGLTLTALLGVSGIMFEKLRHMTTTPLQPVSVQPVEPPSA